MSNKGSDNNVGSIEEDIRILENLKSYLNLLVYEGKDKIIYNDLLWDEKTVDCINAIEHLINNYTRQKQINEEHKKINGELRKKVKELEVLEDDMKDKRIVYIDEPEFKANYIPKQKIKDKIENLEKEYKKLEQSSDFIIADTIQPKIEVLQELLQESEDK